MQTLPGDYFFNLLQVHFTINLVSYSSVLYACNLLLASVRGRIEQNCILHAKKQHRRHCKGHFLLQDLEKRQSLVCAKSSSDSVTHKETEVDCMYKNYPISFTSSKFY